MKVIFKTVQASDGDCVFLNLKKGDKQFVIMVDCGGFGDPVKDYVINHLNKHIDLLVVTHYDRDHIEGVTKMLNEIPGLSIGEIWFNSYQRSNNGEEIPLLESQTVCLRRLYSNIPQVIDVLDTKVNAGHAMTLSETLLRNPKWASAWRREPIKVGMADYPLCGGSFGKLRILSPTQDALNALDEEYLELFYEFFYGEHPKGKLEKDATIYELLMQVAQERDLCGQCKPEQIAAVKLDAQAIQEYCTNKVTSLSKANVASIAFVWEYGDHRILFLGDASPSMVTNSVVKLYGKDVTLFDAIKVSHHGSAHSTTVKMMKKMDSPHFFFTGIGGNERPHIEAISRIINRPLPKGVKARTLHFNYHNDWTDGLDDASLQKTFGYLLDFLKNELTYEI